MVMAAAEVRRTRPSEVAKQRLQGMKGHTATKEEERVLWELLRRWDPETDDAWHRSFHREWWMSLAFYAGLQWAKWDTGTNALREPQDPPWRRRYIANIIWPMTMRAHATMVADQATLRAAPLTAENASVNAAQLADQVYEWATDHIAYEEKREEALLWAVTTGTGFVKFGWNPNLGAEKTVLFPNGTKKSIRIGDIECDSASSFSMRIPRNVSHFRDFPWIIQVTTRPWEYAWERWRERAHLVIPYDNTPLIGEVERKLERLVGKLGFAGGLSIDHYPNAVKVVELWTKPFSSPLDDGGHKDYPKGFHAIFGNSVPLEWGDNPYHEMGFHLPYVPYRYGTMSGRFWGMGLVEQLREPQAEYNLTRSQILEHKDLMSRGKWLLPRGHGIPKTSFTSEAGEIIEYNHTLPPPTAIFPPPLPAYVMESAATCKQEMQDIAAQQEVTEAKAPASVRSGVAIQLLQNKDTLVLAVPKKRLWRSDRQAGEMLLKIVQAKYEEQRTIQIVGPGRVFEVKDFRGADLKNHTALRIFAESSLLDSRAARQQTIMDVMQLGLLDPANPQHRAAIFRALELGEVKDYVQEMTQDEKNADAENDAMANATLPVIPPVHIWEDHEVHARVHKKFLKSAQWRVLPPTQQASAENHYFVHMKYLAEQMLADQAQLDAEKGAPGEVGKASQPGSGTSGAKTKGAGDDGAQGSRGRPSSGGASGQEGGGAGGGQGGGG
jgi:hypothetical protein